MTLQVVGSEGKIFYSISNKKQISKTMPEEWLIFLFRERKYHKIVVIWTRDQSVCNQNV